MSKGKNNITAKIFALIIAIILWSYVMSIENPEISKEYKNINVNLFNVSELERQGIVVMEPKDVKINVKVIGKKSEMDRDRFTASNISAKVDLSGYSEGQVRVPILVSLINNPYNVRIVNYEPKEVLFTLDSVVTEKKIVTVQTTGDLPKDYILGDISSRPQTVLVTGPRTWVNEVSQVVAAVDVTDKTKPFDLPVPIQLKDGQGNDVRGVEKDPSVVDINIPIYRKQVLPIELQTQNELPENYIISEIKINPSTIEVKGNNDIINLTHINTKVIDINELLDKPSMKVELDLPENVELLDPNQEVYIDYIIEEVDIKDYIMDFDELDIRNLDEGLSIGMDELNNSILISLKGSKKDLEEITKEDIKAFIDLVDLEEGKHEVEVQIEPIKNIIIESIDPEILTIDLSTENRT